MANVSSSNGIEQRPKLRFPGFADDYYESTLGEIFEYERPDNYIVSSEKYSDNYSIPVLTANQAFILGYTNETTGVYRKGPVILFDDFTCDMKYADFPFKVKSSAMKLLTTKDEMPLFYGYNLLQHINYKPGGHARHWISIMQPISVSVPGLDEQKKVSAFLELVNQKIEKQQEIISLLKKYKRGVINKLINELVQSSPQYSFGQLVCIQRGGSPRPIDDYITSDESGINWIKIGDVTPDSLYLSQTKERIKPAGARKSRKVLPGDLILSNSMSFGRPYIMQIEGCIHDGWLLIRDESEVFNKKFLCYYLASDIVMAQYRRFAAGSCVSNLNSDLVGSLQIALPPMPDQEKSAAIFEQIDSRVVNAAKEYEFLCKLKQGLLQQLFI